MTDSELLDQYARGGDGAALGELVRRHIGLVYAAARRHVGDAHLAEDVTQAVFMLLAAKASSLRRQVVLAAWLLTATRYASKDAIKMGQRRRRHEAAAALMGRERARLMATDVAEDAELSELADRLDAALDSLNQQDRRAILLRYYEKQPFAHIGVVLGIDEEAARKRVSRATGKLARFFTERGCVATVVMVAIILGRELAAPAPAALVGRVTALALGASSAGGAAAAAGAGAPMRDGVVRLVTAVRRRFIFSTARGVTFYGGGLALLCAACAWGATYRLTHAPPTTQPTQHWGVVQFDAGQAAQPAAKAAS